MTIKKVKIKKRKPLKGKKNLTRRQSSYRFKEGFAANIKDRAKKDYRVSRGSEFALEGVTVLRQLDTVDDFSEMKPVNNSGTNKSSVLPVINQTVLADILNTSYQTIWRWVTKTGQLPEPVLIDQTDDRGRGVYHVSEVRVMIAEIGEHLLHYRYYRKDHSGVRNKVFNQIEALRNAQFKGSTNAKKDTQGKVARSTSRRSRG